MKKINILIKDLDKDEDIYPRVHESPKTIEAYADALRAGAKFPPIVVQRILDDGKEKTIYLDGVHRAKAYEMAGKEEIEARYWRTKVLDKAKWLTRLRLEASRRNSTHGDRLRAEDKKHQARRICESDSQITEQEIADALGVPRETVRDWVKDIKLKQRAGQEATIYRLNALGWTQEEIAEVVGLDQSAISKKLCNLAKSPKLIKSLLERGDSVEEVAEKLGLDLTTAWAMALEGMDDLQRLKTLSGKVEDLNCNPRPYDVWNFSGCHDLMGYKYDGRIPGQLVLQLLYFFTGDSALVVDPFAGSGTVADACLLMNRECLAYDNNPESFRKRVDIRESDALHALKGLKRKVNLIFLDPPYFKKKEKEYGKKSISSLPRPKYLSFFKKLGKECLRHLTPNGRVALLMSDYTEEMPSESIFITDYIDRFKHAGFEVERIIQCPLSTQGFHADFELKFIEARRLGRLSRNLVIFRASRSE